jgi:putative flippase GtrA
MFDRLLPHLPMPAAHRPLIEQIIRYGVVGGLVTMLAVACYSIAAGYFRISEQIANLIAYLVAVGIGYFAHSAVSFRDQAGARSWGQSLRFALVSILSYFLNALWVWLATDVMHGPFWWPIPGMVLVTPLIIFVLNRKWVFA